MTAEFTKETFPRWTVGLHFFVYKMFETAILEQGMSIEEAFKAITEEPESSGAKKISAEKIAAHLRKALTS